MTKFVKSLGIIVFFASINVFAANYTPTQTAAKLDTTPPPANGALTIEQTPPIAMQAFNEAKPAEKPNQDEAENGMKQASTLNSANAEAIANAANAVTEATTAEQASASAASGLTEELDPEIVGATATAMETFSPDSITYNDEPIPA